MAASILHDYQRWKGPDLIPVPSLSTGETSGWYTDVYTAVVGLLALCCFITVGGVFAIVGPWVLFIFAVSTPRRPGQQVLRFYTFGACFCLGMAALLLSAHV